MEKKTRKSFLQLPGVQTILASLLCIMLGLLVGFVVLLLINHTVNPDTGTLYAWEAIVVIVKNFWKYNSEAAQMKYLGNTLVKTAPLLMCGLSVLFAYKVGLFNIGAAGQYVVGAGAALYCALAWNMPWYVCLLAAALAGALLACISGALKAYCNVNEVISCIMLNWISLYSVNSLLMNVKDGNSPYTIKLSQGNPNALIPSMGLETLFSNNRYVTIAIPMAIVVAILIWVLLSKTKLGYELKATGLNNERCEVLRHAREVQHHPDHGHCRCAGGSGRGLHVSSAALRSGRCLSRRCRPWASTALRRPSSAACIPSARSSLRSSSSTLPSAARMWIDSMYSSQISDLISCGDYLPVRLCAVLPAAS